jgi:hypothetical protein
VGPSTSHNPTGLHSLLGDNFALLYVNDVRTSQEAWPVTGIALLCYMLLMFVPQRKHGLLGDSFTLSYVDDIRTSQEARPVTGIAVLC